MDRYLKIDEVIQLTSLSRSTIYNYIKQGLFPKPVKLGARRVGWLYSLLFDWIVKKQNS